MSRDSTELAIRVLNKLWNEAENEEKRAHFVSLGLSERAYTPAQKDYAITLVDTYGIRATSRILEIPRRSIQRWCRASGIRVKRCPAWVYAWAEGRRKRREFWERRGYY